MVFWIYIACRELILPVTHSNDTRDSSRIITALLLAQLKLSSAIQSAHPNKTPPNATNNPITIYFQ
jgi:hypothetical protein